MEEELPFFIYFIYLIVPLLAFLGINFLPWVRTRGLQSALVPCHAC